MTKPNPFAKGEDPAEDPADAAPIDAPQAGAAPAAPAAAEGYQSLPDDQLDIEVEQTMRDLGAGEITVAEAAENIRPSYDYAMAHQRLARTTEDDIAADPMSFHGVALARTLGVITMEQYAALGAALRGEEYTEPGTDGPEE